MSMIIMLIDYYANKFDSCPTKLEKRDILEELKSHIVDKIAEMYNYHESDFSENDYNDIEKDIGMVRSVVAKSGQITEETRYFIVSLTEVTTFVKAVRSHWGIANSLHWVLDAVLYEDACKTRKDNSAKNFSVIRRIAPNILKNYPVKMSLARKRRKCEYGADFIADVFLSVF